MLQQDTIVLQREPYLPTLFAKAALKRGRSAATDLPKVRVRVEGVKVDQRRLGQYQKVCGFQDRNILPLTYPQIMAFGLYMRLLTDKQFPLPLIGLVHLRNEIIQQRPLLPQEIFDFECAIAGQRESEKGLEFDIVTQVFSAGRVVWESTATLLHRRKSGKNGRRTTKQAQSKAFEHRLFWRLPESLGRQYAKVSGDYNLIHLHTLTARFFGFKRPIVHGLWSKARSIAQLLDAKETGPLKVSSSFKLPIFLPGEVDLVWRNIKAGTEFELIDHKTGKPHLTGTIERKD